MNGICLEASEISNEVHSPRHSECALNLGEVHRTGNRCGLAANSPLPHHGQLEITVMSTLSGVLDSGSSATEIH